MEKAHDVTIHILAATETFFKHHFNNIEKLRNELAAIEKENELTEQKLEAQASVYKQLSESQQNEASSSEASTISSIIVDKDNNLSFSSAISFDEFENELETSTSMSLILDETLERTLSPIKTISLSPQSSSSKSPKSVIKPSFRKSRRSSPFKSTGAQLSHSKVSQSLNNAKTKVQRKIQEFHDIYGWQKMPIELINKFENSKSLGRIEVFFMKCPECGISVKICLGRVIKTNEITHSISFYRQHVKWMHNKNTYKNVYRLVDDPATSK